MSFQDIADRGLVLLGCGKMGSALLEGWLSRQLPPGSVYIIDPAGGDHLDAFETRGVHVNASLPDDPALCVLAVKPQVMATAIETVTPLAGKTTLFLSIAAGTTLAQFEAWLGNATPIIRAMPNTPAAIGAGITAIVGNAEASNADLTLSEQLLEAVGKTVRLESEGQMDAVTAVSGSGPAYVFHLIECLAEAGVYQGLPADLAMALAKATVEGAGRLAGAEAADAPSTLRENVTSPRGTTEAGLKELMHPTTGLRPLIARTVKAAADRSRELAG